MTREEAIVFFKDMNECTYGNLEAVEMAIKALEQEPCEDKIIDEHYWKGFNDGIRTEKFRESKREPCEDCVSRQAVADAVEETIAKYIPTLIWRYEKIPLELAIAIRDVPPVTPTRKKGKWIKVTNGRGGHECNICHEYAPSFQNGEEHLSNYCPNCGAEMESEE